MGRGVFVVEVGVSMSLQRAAGGQHHHFPPSTCPSWEGSAPQHAPFVARGGTGEGTSPRSGGTYAGTGQRDVLYKWQAESSTGGILDRHAESSTGGRMERGAALRTWSCRKARSSTTHVVMQENMERGVHTEQAPHRSRSDIPYIPDFPSHQNREILSKLWADNHPPPSKIYSISHT